MPTENNKKRKKLRRRASLICNAAIPQHSAHTLQTPAAYFEIVYTVQHANGLV